MGTSIGVFLAGMKAPREDGGRRILLGDNADGGAVVLRPIRFQCVGVLILTGLPCSFDFIRTPLHAHVKLAMCTLSSVLCRIRIAPHLPVRNKLLRKLVNVCIKWRTFILRDSSYSFAKNVLRGGRRHNIPHLFCKRQAPSIRL